MIAGKPKTSIFIVPRSSSSWRGNEAGWITSSGWAAAGKALWGEALVATTDGVFLPEESRLFPRGASLTGPVRGIRKLVPEPLITAYKDYKLWQSKKGRWPIEDSTWWQDRQPMIVWERHDLFGGHGRRLADRLGVPLVISVEAAVVWEAEKWGVHRPIYGRWLEKSEGTSLRSADLVICVSEEVRRKVISLGVDPQKALVTPNRVDSTLFHLDVKGDEIREQFGLKGNRVIGWTGSFRKFHGLPTVIDAFAEVHRQHPDTVLMLVGDGQELKSVQEKVEAMGLSHSVRLPGRQPFTQIPSFIAAFDIGLVSAASAADFHYSPLKLREYLALGKAIIAPRVGDLPGLFREDEDLVFCQPGDVASHVTAMSRLLTDSLLKGRLEARARYLFEKEGTWVHELKRICKHLGVDPGETGNHLNAPHG